MLQIALRNLLRRPGRTGLTLAALGAAVSVLAFLLALGRGYGLALQAELHRAGVQLMLVPLGCPYDAAARVLKAQTLESSLPHSALAAVRDDPGVLVAAPLLLAAVVRERERRADVWAGVDAAAREVKPWWRARLGASWFVDADSVILGAEAAEVEMRAPGDLLFSPETGRRFRVAGVLERSGTSDDSLFFVPLPAAQAMFAHEGRLTAIAIRLRDPMLLPEVSARLQRIPGAQVVTVTEMMGTFLSLTGSVRVLSQAVAVIAVAVSVLGLFNTLLAAVLERADELAVMRAIGASRRQVFGLLTVEALILGTAGSGLGLLTVAMAGGAVEAAARRFLPFAPDGTMLQLTGTTFLHCLALGLGAGLAASIYPAWQASRIPPAQALKEA